jgi:hypothetical protein
MEDEREGRVVAEAVEAELVMHREAWLGYAISRRVTRVCSAPEQAFTASQMTSGSRPRYCESHGTGVDSFSARGLGLLAGHE